MIENFILIENKRLVMQSGKEDEITNCKILMQYFKFNPVHQSLVLPSLGLSTNLKNI